MKVLVLCGGMSNENNVSLVSGINIYANLDELRYDKKIVYLDEAGRAYEINTNDFYDPEEARNITVGYTPKIIKETELLKEIEYADIVFPAIHGGFGEDGQVQLLMEKQNVVFVGCDSSSSINCFDKAVTKEILDTVGVKMANHVLVNLDETYNGAKDKDEEEKYIEEYLKENSIYERVQELDYPVYIKPVKSGSSVGVYRVEEKDDLKEKIFLASKVDKKILIEEEIKGLEVECAIIENKGKIIASRIGQIIPGEEFYTYNDKYMTNKSKTRILTKENLPEGYDYEEIEKIQYIAKRVFRTLRCKGLSRVDFFLTKNGYVFNEINTMPGFTQISMYPTLIMDLGYTYSEILDILIENALKRGKNER